MTSNDNQQYLTVELFNSKIDTLMTQIQLGNEKLRNELHSEIQDVKSIALVNSAKSEMLQHTFYWGFGIMTLIIALVAIFVPYLMLLRREKKQEQNQPVLTEQKVQDMINTSISQAINDAVVKALGVSGK